MEETGWEMLRNQVRCNFPITVALTQREALEYKLDLIFYSPDTWAKCSPFCISYSLANNTPDSSKLPGASYYLPVDKKAFQCKWEASEYSPWYSSLKQVAHRWVWNEHKGIEFQGVLGGILQSSLQAML